MSKQYRASRAALLVAAALLRAVTASAQSAPAVAPGVLAAVRAADPIDVDGLLNEPAWSTAPVAEGFVQRQPNPGAQSTQRTEVRVLYRNDAVYVGARLYDRPDSIAAQLSRRDATGTYSDWFSVMLDSDRDNLSAFVFAANPKGVRQDYILTEDSREDRSWDAVWTVATHVDSLGWTAEFRIPLSQLRFNAAQQSWGLNFRREIARRGEVSFWAPVPPDAPGIVSRFGALSGLTGLRPPTRLELQPYTMGRVTRAPGNPDNPFYSANQLSASAGADLKYGLTPSFTLTATLNPDFGQVDADPSQVNLTAYETFFPERRPFFVEGSDIFRVDLGNGEGVLYSRRIGRAPRGSVPGGSLFRDMPESSPILGAAKLSGKTSRGWSVGVLEAVTGQGEARFLDTLGNIHSATVEPLTNYAAVRVLKDSRRGQSSLGGFATATYRSIDTPSLEFLPTSAYTVGMDGRHRFGGGNYEVSGWVMGSQVAGDSSAIRILQLSSTHYFQRPDADHLEFDPQRTSLGGIDSRLKVTKVGGGHWRAEVLGRVRTPGFEINDLGFQRTSDWMQQSAYVGYEQFKPGKTFRSWNVYANQFSGWTLGGERINNGFNLNSGFQFRNLWNGYLAVTSLLSRLQVDALRGGPALQAPQSFNVSGGINSDPRKRLIVNLGGGFEVDDAGSAGGSVGGALSYRPSARAQFSLSPSVTLQDGTAQYIGQTTAAGRRRYLFGSIQQRTVSLTARLNYTFTPNLSLQFYAQPFVSAAEYSEFKEVADPRARAFSSRFHTFTGSELSYDPTKRRYGVDVTGDGKAEYGFNNPDFNFKQLRSNTVLRWEYRPGSTLFVVWSQGRSHSAGEGAFRLLSDTRDLFEASGTNVLLLKMSYWLAR